MIFRALVTCVPLLACPAVFLGADFDPTAPTLVLVSGETIPAHLVAADAKQLTFETGKGRRSVAPEDLVSWGAPVEPRGAMQILVGREGVLIGVVSRMDADSLLIHSDLFGNVTLPREAVKGFLLAAPFAVTDRDQLVEQELRVKERVDVVRFENGDKAAGTVQIIDDKQIIVQISDVEISLERRRVAAIRFSRELPATADGLWVGFQDGSRVLADSLRAANDEVTAVVNGVELSTSLSELAFVQRPGGKFTYVSDLKPASEVHVPFLGAAWPAKFDRNVEGGTLRAGSRPWLKGIGMHSASRVTFAIPPNYNRLRGAIAIDDSAGRAGSVVFRVLVDSQQRFKSGVVRGGEAPVAIDVDISGGKLLSLFVEMADQGDVLDRANWLDLRLSEE